LRDVDTLWASLAALSEPAAAPAADRFVGRLLLIYLRLSASLIMIDGRRGE
jgi:hypothetical protein